MYAPLTGEVRGQGDRLHTPVPANLDHRFTLHWCDPPGGCESRWMGVWVGGLVGSKKWVGVWARGRVAPPPPGDPASESMTFNAAGAGGEAWGEDPPAGDGRGQSLPAPAVPEAQRVCAHDVHRLGHGSTERGGLGFRWGWCPVHDHRKGSNPPPRLAVCQTLVHGCHRL